MLWAGLGAAGAGYIFILSTHVPEIPTYSHIPCWVGEPEVIIAAAYLGGTTWGLLTIPVLVAGAVRIGRRRLGAGAGAAWPGAWLAGIALMIQVVNWQTSAPVVLACSKGQGCSLAGYSRAVVSWGELAVFAAWLAVAAAMALALARPARSRDLSDASSRPSSMASL